MRIRLANARISMLHVDIMLDMSCAMMSMHAFHCGGQDYKQRLTPYEATRATVVLTLPTSHPSLASSMMVAPRQVRQTSSFSAKYRRQRTLRHWR